MAPDRRFLGGSQLGALDRALPPNPRLVHAAPTRVGSFSRARQETAPGAEGPRGRVPLSVAFGRDLRHIPAPARESEDGSPCSFDANPAARKPKPPCRRRLRGSARTPPCRAGGRGLIRGQFVDVPLAKPWPPRRRNPGPVSASPHNPSARPDPACHRGRGTSAPRRPSNSRSTSSRPIPMRGRTTRSTSARVCSSAATRRPTTRWSGTPSGCGDSCTRASSTRTSTQQTSAAMRSTASTCASSCRSSNASVRPLSCARASCRSRRSRRAAAEPVQLPALLRDHRDHHRAPVLGDRGRRRSSRPRRCAENGFVGRGVGDDPRQAGYRSIRASRTARSIAPRPTSFQLAPDRPTVLLMGGGNADRAARASPSACSTCRARRGCWSSAARTRGSGCACARSPRRRPGACACSGSPATALLSAADVIATKAGGLTCSERPSRCRRRSSNTLFGYCPLLAQRIAPHVLDEPGPVGEIVHPEAGQQLLVAPDGEEPGVVLVGHALAEQAVALQHRVGGGVGSSVSRYPSMRRRQLSTSAFSTLMARVSRIGSSASERIRIWYVKYPRVL